jgi:hypothetical protein
MCYIWPQRELVGRLVAIKLPMLCVMISGPCGRMDCPFASRLFNRSQSLPCNEEEYGEAYEKN